MKPTVKILVTVTKPELFKCSTLCFDTLRVGFPTHNIHVFDNCNKKEDKKAIAKMADKCDAQFIELNRVHHHADWIRMQVLTSHGPIVIVDPDSLFWANCEWFKFNTVLAGFYVPIIWNEFAQCISVERLHTCFLQISDTKELRDKIQHAYKWCDGKTGDYNSCDPYMPSVKFVRGEPMFWDTCANLYNMIGGTAFESEHLECFDHINSASFYDVMMERVEDKENFAKMHETAMKEPMKMKGFWTAVCQYYTQMNQKAQLLSKQKNENTKPTDSRNRAEDCDDGK